MTIFIKKMRNKMYDTILDFICDLHGYLIRLKEIHWSTNSNDEHLLCDEIMDAIRGLEDELMETTMGMLDKKISVGELKPYLPNATELKGVLKELLNDTTSTRKKIKDGEDATGGILSIIDDIVAMAQKYQYRATQVGK